MMAAQSGAQSADAAQFAVTLAYVAGMKAETTALRAMLQNASAERSAGQSVLSVEESETLNWYSALMNLGRRWETRRAAARVSECAAASTWLVTIVDASPARCTSVCTAFAYEPAPGAPVAFVSAGHCFDGAFVGVGHAVVLERAGDGRSLNCTVASLSTSALADDAILDCPGAAGVAGLRPARPGRAVVGLPVAAVGFFLDSLSPRRVARSEYALTTMLARVGDAAGEGGVYAAAPAAGEVPASCNATRWSALEQAAGFIDRAVAHGMSGGPLLDMSCGIVGITSARSCGAGVFVGLGGVDARLARVGA